MGSFEDLMEPGGAAERAPVCWRCMRVEVLAAGDECVECPPPLIPSQQRGLLRGPVSANHSKAVYDPRERPDPAEMTAEEREAEILYLTKTQAVGQPPRETEWTKRVVLMGGNPRDLRSSIGVYHRGRLVRRDGGYSNPFEQRGEQHD